jgi:hypothetical protein
MRRPDCRSSSRQMAARSQQSYTRGR